MSAAKTNRYFTFPVYPRQNQWLDFLRAIAVVLVLLRHGEVSLNRAGYAGLETAAPPLHNLFLNGWVGVDLFLVLSGFLIGKGLMKSFASTGSISVGSYFYKRAIRIITTYYFVLFITAAGLFPFYAVEGKHLGIRILYHMLFLQDYLPSNINVVFWSLGVEEKFYILVPILILVISRMRTVKSVVLLLIGLCLLVTAVRALKFLGGPQEIDYLAFFRGFRSPFHASLEPLLMGVMIGYLWSKEVAFKVSVPPKIVLFAVLGVAAFWLASQEFLSRISIFDAGVQPLLTGGLFALAVYCGVYMKGVNLWGEVVWRVIARLSYTLYLLHFPLIPLAMKLTMEQQQSAWLFWVVYLLLTLIASLLVHFAIEKPSLIFKDKMSLKFGGQET